MKTHPDNVDKMAGNVGSSAQILFMDRNTGILDGANPASPPVGMDVVQALVSGAGEKNRLMVFYSNTANNQWQIQMINSSTGVQDDILPGVYSCVSAVDIPEQYSVASLENEGTVFKIIVRNYGYFIKFFLDIIDASITSVSTGILAWDNLTRSIAVLTDHSTTSLHIYELET